MTPRLDASGRRHANADGRRGRAPAPGGVGALGAGRVRVAIVGGTGDFGRGLAKRLSAAGDDVVIGSRDAERAAGCRAGAQCRAAGRTRRSCAAPTSSSWPSPPAPRCRRRSRSRGRPARRRSSRSPASCVSGRDRPARKRRAFGRGAGRRSRSGPGCRGPPLPCRQHARWEPPAGRGRPRLRRRSGREGAFARARLPPRRRPRPRRRAARERARAGRAHRGDRQPQPPVQGPRRASASPACRERVSRHRRRGPARDRRRRRSRLADRGSGRARGRRRRGHRPEGRLQGGGSRPLTRRRRALAVRARDLRRPRPAADRGDPGRDGTDRAAAAAAPDRPDEARLRLRLRRRRRLERAANRNGRPPSRGTPMRRPSASAPGSRS